MKLTSLFAMILGSLISISAKADIIKCYFTEPFFYTTYSMAQQALTYENMIAADDKKINVIKNVSFQIKAAGVFELVSQDGKVLQTLTLNNQGSDGMSDTTYPYDAKDESGAMGNQPMFGGCTSNQLSATNK